MGQVLGENVWVGRVFLAKGSPRVGLDPEVAGLVGAHLWADEACRPNVDPRSGEALTGLRDNVWVDGVLYTKGSTDIPAYVVPKIGDHMWVDGPPSAPPAESSPAVSSGDEPDSDGIPKPPVGTPPNKGGKDSSAALWLAYAEANKVEVHAKAERAEIIAALTEAGVPTD